MATPKRYGNKTDTAQNAESLRLNREYPMYKTVPSKNEVKKAEIGYYYIDNGKVKNQTVKNVSAERYRGRSLNEGYRSTIPRTPSFHKAIKMTMANYSAQNKLYKIPFMATHYKNSAKDYTVVTSPSVESLGHIRKPLEVLPILSRSIEMLSCSLNMKVKEAIFNKRVYTMAYNCDIIREELEKRNWIEKLAPRRYQELLQLSFNPMVSNQGNNYNTMAMTKALREYPANFVWQGTPYNEFAAQSHPFRNRTHRRDDVDFTTKSGLLGCVKIAQSKQKNAKCAISHPRCFSLNGYSRVNYPFTEEYRRTLCHCVIRYMCLNHSNADPIIDNCLGTIPSNIISFALTHLEHYLKNGNEEKKYIPRRAGDPNVKEWEAFMKNATNFLHNGEKLKMFEKDLDLAVEKGKLILEKVEALNENFHWDGCYNIWIMKPSYRCRGYGIIIKNNLQEILQYAYRHSHQYFIVQKYIERPMLIYKTKFDMRVYMLQTITEDKICIWLYDDCYLRFSSREFQLKDFDKSIHLTNNAIQRYCRNQVNRNKKLPSHNMWSLKEFKLYLEQNYEEKKIWETKIVRAIERNLKAVVEVSLMGLYVVKNEFELFGCDFMLDEKLNTILLEINSNPDLSSSTEVTACICPNVLRDLIKVVVDRSQNRNAATGKFKLIHTIKYKFYTKPGNRGKAQFQPLPYSVFE